MFETVVHRWLRIPFSLNVHFVRKPKRPRATVLFIHGIGNTGQAWDDVIKRLPKDTTVVSIDLLGFGRSPAPKWAVYNAKTQARSVLATYLGLRIMSPVVIVGHSLGALVAIEVAKRYPMLTKSLILCSPPLYDTDVLEKASRFKTDRILRQLYQAAYDRPEDFVKLSAIVTKYKLINKSFNVTTKNIDSYMAALKAMIINQTSLEDARKLKVPTIILRGTLDPFVVAKNLKRLTQQNENITLKSVIAGHEVKGTFVGPVVKVISQQIPPVK